MDYSFVTMSDLQYRIVSLKRELEAFKTGDKYISLKNEYHAMLAHEEKIIRGLEQELSSAHQQIKKVRNNWYATCEMVAEENRKTIKTKHIYYTYRCKCCGQLIRVPLEPGTKNI